MYLTLSEPHLASMGGQTDRPCGTQASLLCSANLSYRQPEKSGINGMFHLSFRDTVHENLNKFVNGKFTQLRMFFLLLLG